MRFKNPEAEKTVSMLNPKFGDIIKKLPYDLMATIGTRSEGVNQSVGGAKNSAHLSGNAADFRITDQSPDNVQKAIDWFNSQGANASIHTKGTAPHLHVQMGGGHVENTGGNKMAFLDKFKSAFKAPVSQGAETYKPMMENYGALLDALGYKQASPAQNILSKISQAGYGVAGAASHLGGQPELGDYYNKQSLAAAPNADRKALMTKLLMEKLTSKPDAGTSAMQNYQYYLGTNPQNPVDFYTFAKSGAAGGGGVNLDMSSMLNDLTGFISGVQNFKKTPPINTPIPQADTKKTDTKQTTESDYGYSER